MGKHHEAVEEVLAERPLLDLVGRLRLVAADDPHVDCFSWSRRGGDGPLLQRPEELGLQVRGSSPDLVEEERPAVTSSRAPLVVVGAGEGALRYAKELALEQVLGQRGAVLRHNSLSRRRDL